MFDKKITIFKYWTCDLAAKIKNNSNSPHCGLEKIKNECSRDRRGSV